MDLMMFNLGMIAFGVVMVFAGLLICDFMFGVAWLNTRWIIMAIWVFSCISMVMYMKLSDLVFPIQECNLKILISVYSFSISFALIGLIIGGFKKR